MLYFQALDVIQEVVNITGLKYSRMAVPSFSEKDAELMEVQN